MGHIYFSYTVHTTETQGLKVVRGPYNRNVWDGERDAGNAMEVRVGHAAASRLGARKAARSSAYSSTVWREQVMIGSAWNRGGQLCLTMHQRKARVSYRERREHVVLGRREFSMVVAPFVKLFRLRCRKNQSKAKKKKKPEWQP